MQHDAMQPSAINVQNRWKGSPLKWPTDSVSILLSTLTMPHNVQ